MLGVSQRTGFLHSQLLYFHHASNMTGAKEINLLKVKKNNILLECKVT